jgi:hypothetical protein
VSREGSIPRDPGFSLPKICILQKDSNDKYKLSERDKFYVGDFGYNKLWFYQAITS